MPSSLQHPPSVYSTAEAADYLRISRAGLYRLFREEGLRKTKIGGRTVVRRIDLDAFLDRCSQAVDAADTN